MSNVLDILSKKVNINYESERMSYDGFEFPLYKCSRKEEVLQKQVISKYMIFDLTSEEGLFNEISLSQKAFDLFQEKYIAPLFYKHRDDLRWNIYTIFILENKESYSNETKFIENDENYSRKFVFSLDELKEFLLYGYLGNITKNESQSLKTNFVLEWENALSEADLSGCIYNSMKTLSVNEYISTGKAINPVGRPLKHKTQDDPEENILIEKIKNVSFTNFRSHCFGEKFNFGSCDINLFSGTNGSGKTSLCEAIEYGLTGKVKGVKPNSNSKVDVKCISTSKETVNFSSNIKSKRQRELDLSWYGTTTTGNKSRLNENFSIFNYLNANAAMSYVNSKSNMNDILQNLIYGDETTEAKAKIERYSNEFSTNLKRISKERKEKRSKIEVVNQKIDSLKKSASSFTNFNEIFKNVGLDDKKISINELDEERILTEVIKNSRESVAMLVDYFSIARKESNYDDLVNGLMSHKSALRNKEEAIKLLEEDEKKLKADKIELASLIDKKELLHRRSEQLKELKKLLNRLTLEKVNGIDEINKFIDSYEKTMKTVKDLSEMRSDFEEVLTLNEVPHIDFDAYEKLLHEINKTKIQIDDYKIKINSRKDISNTNKSILRNLKEYGIRYVNKNSSSFKCPLCNHNYEDNKMLLQAIIDTENLSDKLSLELVNDKNHVFTLEEEMNELMKGKDEYQRKLKIKEDIDKLRFTFADIVGEEAKTVPIEITAHITDLIKLNNEFLIRNRDNYNYANKIRDNNLLKEFKLSDKDNLKENVKFKSNETLDSLELLLNDLRKLEDKVVEFSGLEEKLQNEIRSREKLLIEINKKEMALDNMNNISKYFNIINQNVDFLNWSYEYNKLEKMSNDLYDSSILSKSLKEEIENLNNLKEKLHSLDIQISRCKRALETFDSLPSLEDNMKSFINENARKIEKIFRLVHRPKEFSDISIEEGEVKFVRDSTGEKTDISEVSTGQSVSLIFAITLCLHLSAEKAPKFIILDEPVANLDDMHIINLIDIIRELALSGTQIFITTANNQVANYLRRKFSFFGKSFKHIRLERTDENPSDIYEYIYSPYKEDPVEHKKLS